MHSPVAQAVVPGTAPARQAHDRKAGGADRESQASVAGGVRHPAKVLGNGAEVGRKRMAGGQPRKDGTRETVMKERGSAEFAVTGRDEIDGLATSRRGEDLGSCC